MAAPLTPRTRTARRGQRRRHLRTKSPTTQHAPANSIHSNATTTRPTPRPQHRRPRPRPRRHRHSAHAAPAASANPRSFCNSPHKSAAPSNQPASKSCKPATPTKILPSTTAPPSPTPKAARSSSAYTSASTGTARHRPRLRQLPTFPPPPKPTTASSPGIARKLLSSTSATNFADLVQAILTQSFRGCPHHAQSAAIRQLRTTAAPAIAVEIASVSRRRSQRTRPHGARHRRRHRPRLLTFRPSYVVATNGTRWIRPMSNWVQVGASTGLCRPSPSSSPRSTSRSCSRHVKQSAAKTSPATEDEARRELSQTLTAPPNGHA